MVTDKVIRGRGTHRILLALSGAPRSPGELRRLVGAVNSTMKFEAGYMERLEVNGFAFKVDGLWQISLKGRQKLESMGLPETVGVAAPRVRVFVPAAQDRAPVLRPGSMDFEDWPSRRGRFLYYRDGRVEEIL